MKHNPQYGQFDWYRFGIAIRDKFVPMKAGMREIAGRVGVPLVDFSRAMGGQKVSVPRALALCNWLGRDIHEFYLQPADVSRLECSTFDQVEQFEKPQHSKARAS